MNLLLKRKPSFINATIGELFIDDKFECFTLEDVVRSGRKVYGETAIDTGHYKITITRSNRFSSIAGRDVFLPLLHDVKDFEGVRIHGGNTPADTDGCILVGQQVGPDKCSILRSQAALIPLQAKIQNALNNNEEVWITIQ